MQFILFDNNTVTCDLNISTIYQETIWNILSTHLKSPTFSPSFGLTEEYHEKLSSNQIFRLLQIGNYDDTYKLYLYSLPGCKSIEVTSNLKFVKENIYNLSYYSSGEYLKLKTNETYTDKNKKLDKLIYNNTFLRDVKKIRIEAYGEELEEDVNISMIPIAYDKHGLFWMPNKYHH